MEFRILGPVGVWENGVEIQLDGSKQRTVLTSLLLARGHVVPDFQLSNVLWGWNPPATYNAQIYTYVSRLRRYLGPSVEIERRRPGYLLRTHAHLFDHAEFERLTTLGRQNLEQARYDLAGHNFRAALELWRGRPLVNVTDHLADAELPWLTEARTAALESRLEADLHLGRHAEVVAELTALVAEHPIRERLRAQLMTALYRCDRQGDALAVFQQGRKVLTEELGVDPGPLLSEAHHAILVGDRPPAAESAAALTPGRAWTSVVPAMLPPAAADFVGRRGQIADLTSLLTGPVGEPADSRATQVLVTGAVGTGKSALAVRVATACRGAFDGGQLYIDLTGEDGRPKAARDVLRWFLRALGNDEREIPVDLDERMQLYRSQLAQRQVLVLLDNAVSADQVLPLLPGPGSSRTVVTSRTHLAGLDGAQVVELGMLESEECRELLIAVLGRQRVESETAEADRIIQLCGQLPLAVRIAGLRLAPKRRWPLGRLARRLGEDRHRLDALCAGHLDVRARLRGPYDALDPAAAEAFRLLALLDVPHFSAWAAAAVLDVPEVAAEQLLETLVDRHLVELTGVDRMGCPRYRYHVLTRAFAWEQAHRHDSPARRCAAVSRALSAGSSLAEQADGLLSRRVLDVLTERVVPSRGSGRSDPAHDPMGWFESEESTLMALFQQACTSGKHTAAWRLAEAMNGFLSVRQLKSQVRWTQQSMDGLATR
jgi:DNA-binding SARP family transcriptional activator